MRSVDNAAWQEPEYDLVWPAPPETTRVRFLRALYGPDDFKSETASGGFFTWLLGEEVAGIPLLNPHAVTADGMGRIWVADPGSRLIYIFDLARERVDYIQEVNGFPLEYPVGVAFDAERKRLFVSDTFRKTVLVLNEDGDYISEWTPPDGYKRPAGMALDASGNLYVADALDGRVVVFDQSGSYLRHIGSQAATDGLFTRPISVAIGPGGELLVVDAMNFRVEVQGPDGELSATIGRLGDSAGSFARPRGIAVDPSGHVFVSDSAFDNIQVFDMAGRLLMYFGSAGKTPGTFNLPAGMFADAQGRLYVADPYNQRVQIFQSLQ